ncbi:MAG: TlpA family protein disulfide reductase [Acidimicrobiales bacterium]
MMFISLGIGALIALILIVVVSILTGGSSPSTSQTSKNALIGTKVSGFTLNSLSGGTVSAPYQSGHPTVLFFFASWCGPCHVELPRVAKYLSSHPQDSVKIIGLDEVDNPKSGLAFAQKSGVTFPLASDPNGNVEASIFKFAYLPYTVFVDAKGVVRTVDYAPISIANLNKGLASISKG